MRYIATTSFSQGNKNVLNTPDGGMHIERGRVIDLPFDLPITKLPKDEYLKYSVFFSQQPMLVPIDSEQGKQLVAEIQSAKKLDAEKKRAETARSRPHKYWYERPVGIVLLAALAAVAAWFVCELIAHHFPHLFHP